VISTAVPTFQNSQLNGTTVNATQPYQKLLIEDGGRNNGSTYNFAPIQRLSHPLRGPDT